MRLARVLGAFGRALISAGVIVLLFVGYQLWGTGLQHGQAQSSLGDEFEEFLALAEAVQPEIELASTDPEPVADADPGTDTEDVTEDDTETEEASDPSAVTAEPEAEAEVEEPIEYSQEFLDLIYPEAGATLARITMADIEVDQFVVSGVSVEDLRKGPGHYPSTANPGTAGNASIAGHRTTYGAPFHRVDELQPGSEVVIQTVQGTFTYLVLPNAAVVTEEGSDPCRQAADLAIDDLSDEAANNPSAVADAIRAAEAQVESEGVNCEGHFIVDPSATWVLRQQEGQNLLTLTACHPKFSARQRIIVQAVLVGEPAPTIPRDAADDFDPGPINLDAGAEDEARGDQRAVGLDDTPEDLQQVISDEVAAADDPSLLEDAETSDEVAAEAPATDDAEADRSPTQITVDDVSDVDDAEAAGVPDAVQEQVELTNSEGPISDDDFGTGLNGDRTKIRPAIMWGVAGGAIWMAAWFMGQRLNRKWTLYLIGLVPFVPVLWSTFVNIDQALPSY